MTDRWATALATTLDDVGARLHRLADRVAVDWPDQRGRDWGERAGHLRRELAERAAEAAGWAARLASVTEPAAADPRPAPSRPVGRGSASVVPTPSAPTTSAGCASPSSRRTEPGQRWLSRVPATLPLTSTSTRSSSSS